MKELISSEKIQKPLAENYPDRNVFSISISDVHLARFYVTPEAQTIAWDGEIDFSTLETTAINVLPQLIFRDSNHVQYLQEEGSKEVFRSPSPTSTQAEEMTRLATLVSFIFSKGKTTLEEYDLTNPEHYIRYQEAIQSLSNIEFARYDVFGMVKGEQVSYTFTAENPDLLDAATPEMTIQLPRSRVWSGNTLAWVISHHISAAELGPIHPQIVADTISRLSRM